MSHKRIQLSFSTLAICLEMCSFFLSNLVIHYLGQGLGLLAICIAVSWAAGALYFDLPTLKGVRICVAFIWAMIGPALFLFEVPLQTALVITGIIFALIMGWWLTLQPRLDRDWKPELSVLAYGVVHDDVITLHNVRNFDYRTETDFTPRFETRTYDLRKLRALDLFQNYWGSPLMAHPILSFDFGDDGHLCFTIETRQRCGQRYSSVAGFYRQFELIYIPADEHDVVRVRTNFREGTDVYLYRLKTAPEYRRAYFLDYVRRLNELRIQPEWYNAVMNNCTTNIRTQRAASERFPWDWRLLVNGYADRLLYERGALDQTLPFAELKRRAHINERARSADNAADFSARIRTHFRITPFHE